MASTSDTTVTQADWSQLNSGSVSLATVQLKSSGPVLVAVATSKPSAASTEGLVLDAEGLPEFPFPSLGATDNIYARSMENEANTLVIYEVPAA